MGSDGRGSTVLGTTIGKHRISRLIGSGATGRVFACTDPDEKTVAIKVLRSVHAALGERLLRDRLLLEKIQSPYVAQILDVALFNNAPYVVMELVDGESLAEQLKRGPLRTVDGLTIARELAEGLMAAWAHGIAHGDLRPKNVLMSGGHVKITDFMLAPRIDGTESLRGTPSYMAPELLVGTPPDALSDIYALGCTLFEILIGKPPYTGNPATILHFQAHEPSPSLERALPGAPQFLVDLLARLLEKDRARRLKTYSEVLTAIDRALKGASMPALSKPQIPELDVDMDIEGEDDGYDEKTAEIHSSPARDLLDSIDDDTGDQPNVMPARPAPAPAFIDEIADAQTRMRPMDVALDKEPSAEELIFDGADEEFDFAAADPPTADLGPSGGEEEATRIAPEIATPAPVLPPLLPSFRPQAVPREPSSVAQGSAPAPAPVEITNVNVATESFGVYRSKSSQSVVEENPLLADDPDADVLIDDSDGDDGEVFAIEEDDDGDGEVFTPDDDEPISDPSATVPGIPVQPSLQMDHGITRSEIESVLDDPSTQLALEDDSFEEPTQAGEDIGAPAGPVSADEIGLVLTPASAEELGISLQPLDEDLPPQAEEEEEYSDYGGGLAPLDTDFLSAPLTHDDRAPVLPVMPGGLTTPKKR